MGIQLVGRFAKTVQSGDHWPAHPLIAGGYPGADLGHAAGNVCGKTVAIACLQSVAQVHAGSRLVFQRQGSCPGVYRSHFEVIREFLPVSHARTPGVRSTAVVEKRLGEEVLEEIRIRGRAAAKDGQMAGAVVKSGALESTVWAQTPLKREFLVPAAFQQRMAVAPEHGGKGVELN